MTADEFLALLSLDKQLVRCQCLSSCTRICSFVVVKQVNRVPGACTSTTMLPAETLRMLKSAADFKLAVLKYYKTSNYWYESTAKLVCVCVCVCIPAAAAPEA